MRLRYRKRTIIIIYRLRSNAKKSSSSSDNVVVENLSCCRLTGRIWTTAANPTNGRRTNERTNEQAALVDGSGGVCDYRGIRSLYIRIYRGGGGGGGDYDIRGRRRRRSHGPQCAFSDGPGRAQETDRKHALPVHNGPMAAIQEHTGNERVRWGKRKNRSINPCSRQKEQPLGGKREVCNNVNDFFFLHTQLGAATAAHTAVPRCPVGFGSGQTYIFFTFY